MRPVVLALLVLLAGAAEALPGQQAVTPPTDSQSIALKGRWTLNVRRTRYGQSAEPRQRETFACDVVSSQVCCSIRSVRQDGREVVGRFTAPLDGSSAAVTGIAGIDHVQLRPSARGLLDATFSWQGKPAFAYRAFRSSDGRSLTIVSVDPLTRAVLTTAVVYDRQ